MKRRGRRHDGGQSRECPYCFEVGARVVVGAGKRGGIVFAHRRCIRAREQLNKTTGDRRG